MIAHFLVLSSPVLLDAFALPSPLETFLQRLLRLLHSAAFSFTEGVEAMRRNCHPLSPAHGPPQASVPTLIFPPLTVGRLSLFLAQALLSRVHPLPCLLKYSGTPLQQLFPTLLRHQIFPQIGLASHWRFISFCHVTAKLPEIVVYSLTPFLFFQSPSLGPLLIRLFPAVSLPRANPTL